MSDALFATLSEQLEARGLDVEGVLAGWRAGSSRISCATCNAGA